jgi:hypothetical protein
MLSHLPINHLGISFRKLICISIAAKNGARQRTEKKNFDHTSGDTWNYANAIWLKTLAITQLLLLLSFPAFFNGSPNDGFQRHRVTSYTTNFSFLLFVFTWKRRICEMCGSATGVITKQAFAIKGASLSIWTEFPLTPHSRPSCGKLFFLLDCARFYQISTHIDRHWDAEAMKERKELGSRNHFYA